MLKGFHFCVGDCFGPLLRKYGCISYHMFQDHQFPMRCLGVPTTKKTYSKPSWNSISRAQSVAGEGLYEEQQESGFT